MNSTHSRRIRLIQILFSAAIVFALMLAREVKAGDDHKVLVSDWSHRHLVFSEPNSLAKRFELSSNPRYVQQRRRQSAERRHDRDEWRWRRAPENPNQIQGDWSMDMGSGATVGAGNYPAKFSFDTTSANCASAAQPDFVVYNTSLAGSSTQASIVAFDNIYKIGCTGTTPQVYWSYNTGSGAAVTSPVLSFDGKQVAFIQNTAGASNLVVLRWKANDGTLAFPSTPGAGPCLPAAAPCQSTVALSTATASCTGVDSFSSPFYDYAQDVLYVGDNSGCLHKFTGVFLGTPTEVVASGANVWPAALTGGFGNLSSPVLVPQSGSNISEVLVTGGDGEIYAVDTTIGGVFPGGENAIDPKLASPGFDDGPLVDVTSGKVYVFARASSPFVDSSRIICCAGFPGTPNVASVFQINIPATPSDIHFAPYVQAIVSDSATIPASAFYVGAFSNEYYSSGNNTGNLYVCSTSGTVNAIWRIEINTGTIGTIAVGPKLTSVNSACSPITEYFNTSTSTDQLFLSVAGSALTGDPVINCPAATGCIMSFDLPSDLTPTTHTAATASEAGGTSGIVIDNSSATPGADQVYFTPLSDQACVGAGGVGNGSGGCAIQASQIGLN